MTWVMAAVGATTGAMLNPDDPLKGALIGGTLGGGGSAFASSFGTAAGGAGAAGGALPSGSGIVSAGAGGVPEMVPLTSLPSGALNSGIQMGPGGVPQISGGLRGADIVGMGAGGAPQGIGGQIPQPFIDRLKGFGRKVADSAGSPEVSGLAAQMILENENKPQQFAPAGTIGQRGQATPSQNLFLELRRRGQR